MLPKPIPSRTFCLVGLPFQPKSFARLDTPDWPTPKACHQETALAVAAAPKASTPDRAVNSTSQPILEAHSQDRLPP